jgi:hypothetical protein
MRSKNPSNTGRRVGVVGAIAAVLLLVSAGPARADTSQASARAVSLTLFQQPVVDSGTATATNDGSGETKTGPTSPALGVLGAQSVLGAGVLAQNAVSRNDGTSAACAGVVGAGGIIQIGPAGDCAVSQASPGGVVLNLAPLTTLTADAILAQCTAASNGTTTSTVTIVNGKVTTGTPPVETTLLSLPLHADPNTGLSIPAVVTLMLNEQTSPPPAGSVATSALHLQLLGGLGTGANLTIGAVACGPNASTNEIPTFVAKGLPLSALVVGGIGATVWVHRRRDHGAVA